MKLRRSRVAILTAALALAGLAGASGAVAKEGAEARLEGPFRPPPGRPRPALG